jgi:hypothetical protein
MREDKRDERRDAGSVCAARAIVARLEAEIAAVRAKKARRDERAAMRADLRARIDVASKAAREWLDTPIGNVNAIETPRVFPRVTDADDTITSRCARPLPEAARETNEPRRLESFTYTAAGFTWR